MSTLGAIDRARAGEGARRCAAEPEEEGGAPGGPSSDDGRDGGADDPLGYDEYDCFLDGWGDGIGAEPPDVVEDFLEFYEPPLPDSSGDKSPAYSLSSEGEDAEAEASLDHAPLPPTAAEGAESCHINFQGYVKSDLAPWNNGALGRIVVFPVMAAPEHQKVYCQCLKHDSLCKTKLMPRLSVSDADLLIWLCSGEYRRRAPDDPETQASIDRRLGVLHRSVGVSN